MHLRAIGQRLDGFSGGRVWHAKRIAEQWLVDSGQ
jgi:hypothetical protein